MPERQNLQGPQAGPTRASATEENDRTREFETEEPQPLTAEGVLAENRRNDFLIAGGVLVMAVLLACHKVNNGDFWVHLRSGSYMSAQRSIVDKDPFSYTATDRPWINLAWLYDRAVYALQTAMQRTRIDGSFEDVVSGAMPTAVAADKVGEPAAQVGQSLGVRVKLRPTLKGTARADLDEDDVVVALNGQAVKTADEFGRKVAALRAPAQATLDLRRNGKTIQEPLSIEASTGGLVAVKAALVALAAAMLLMIRHPGPTLWWTAMCVAAALLPAEKDLGLRPEMLSFVLLAAVLLLLHGARYRCWQWRLWLLVPMQVLWVNVDAGFLLGPVTVGLFLLGEALARLSRPTASPADTPGVACPLAGAPVGWLAAVLAGMCLACLANPYGWTAVQEALELYRANREGWSASQVGRSFWADLFGTDLGTMLLRTALPILAVGSFVLNWRRLSLSRLFVFLGLSLVALVALGDVGVASVVSGVSLALNGQEWFLAKYGTETRVSRRWVLWSHGGRAASVAILFLAVLGGMTGRLSAEPWKWEFGLGSHPSIVMPEAAVYLSNVGLAGNSLVLDTGLRLNDYLLWRLPERKVFIDSRATVYGDVNKTYADVRRALRDGVVTQWKRALDDHEINYVVLNMRPPDAFTRTFLRLSVDRDQWALVHRDTATAVFARRDVVAHAEFIKKHELKYEPLAFRESSDLLPPPPRPPQGRGWLESLWRSRLTPTDNAWLANMLLRWRQPRPWAPPPEDCFLAIRAARAGLLEDADDPGAYKVLAFAYGYLLEHEMGYWMLSADPQDSPLRNLQTLAAMNQAVLTQPDDVEIRRALVKYCYDNGYFDLALEHLDRELALTSEKNERRLQLRAELFDHVEETKEGLAAIEKQQVNAFMLADTALRRGCPKLAAERLAEISAVTRGYAEAQAMLARRYLAMGLPDQAAVPLKQVHPLQLEPGEHEELMGVGSLLAGDYRNALVYLEHAIAQIRRAMVFDYSDMLMMGFQSRLEAVVRRGGPARTAGLQQRQAVLQFYAGMARLEGGEPIEAARHFHDCLKLDERMRYRPILAAYLERITGEEIIPDLDRTPLPKLEDDPQGGKPEANADQ